MIEIMNVELPEYGETIIENGNEYVCKGIQVYFGINNIVSSYRIHIGNGKYITKHMGGGYEANKKTN